MINNVCHIDLEKKSSKTRWCMNIYNICCSGLTLLIFCFRVVVIEFKIHMACVVMGSHCESMSYRWWQSGLFKSIDSSALVSHWLLCCHTWMACQHGTYPRKCSNVARARSHLPPTGGTVGGKWLCTCVPLQCKCDVTAWNIVFAHVCLQKTLWFAVADENADCFASVPICLWLGDCYLLVDDIFIRSVSNMICNAIHFLHVLSRIVANISESCLLFFNSYVSHTGGKHYQKIIIPIFRLVLQK